METMIKTFYNVMCKYEKHFSEHGVRANLNKWDENKSGLAMLLRTHPNWDEDAMAIVIPIVESRDIDNSTVTENASQLLFLSREIGLTPKERGQFNSALTAATEDCCALLSESKAEIISGICGVKCVEGQKVTRVIGKLCRKFGVEKHEQYNAVYTPLADSLSPKAVQKKALLSVHPCSFLEMSDKNNSWSSCHNLKNGNYQSGCLSYMNDSTTMIFYTVDGDVTDEFCKAPKRSRQVFCYAEGMLLQSRLYPKDSVELMKQYRNLVQEVIATCLTVPNQWVLKKKLKETEDKLFVTADGSRQYTDYNHHGTLSVLKGLNAQGHIIIGEKAYCVSCGQPLQCGNIKCNCENKVVCQECGKTVPANTARYQENVWLCNICLHICSSCGTVVRSNSALAPAYNKQGDVVHICVSCYHMAFLPCSICSVQAVCSTTQSNRYCQRTAIAS